MSCRVALSGLACFAAFTFGCADGGAPNEEEVTAEPAIALGADGSHDLADTACKVVLRDVTRLPNGSGGFMALPPDGRWVWEGQLDVDPAAVADGAEVHVLFATTDTRGTWYAAPAVRVGTAGAFARYVFRLDTFTPRSGTSGTGLARASVELVPYIATRDGRLFDHNRVHDALGSYRLDASNGFAVAADEVCTASADGAPRWRFDWPGWGDRLGGGPLVGGGAVRIAYDGRRLRAEGPCMGSHGAASGTTIYMHAMIDGDPETITTAEVERYTVGPSGACGPAGTCVSQTINEPLVPLPDGASDLAVWFECVPGFGSAPGARFDSKDGANYHQPIEAPVPVDWMGGWALYRARAGDAVALPEPLVYRGFTNMGLALQAEVWAEGVAAADLIVEVESDALGCTPGTLTRERLPWVAADAGPYGHNALYRWGIESLLGRCPAGTYRFRFLASADGGRTYSALGAASEATAERSDSTFRTIENQRPR